MGRAMRRIKLYAHRGGSGLMPENTLPAYQTSLNLGVDAIDGDLAITKDKTIVIFHDQKLNPDIMRKRDINGKLNYITDANHLIKDLTYSELLQYDVGSINPQSTYAKSFPAQRQLDRVYIPTLADVIKLLKHPCLSTLC